MEKETKVDVIEDKIEFLPGEEGWYIKKTNALFKAIVKVDKNPTADTVEEELIFHAKKIPGPVFRSWQLFCRDVCMKAKRDSEAGLILVYHPKKKEWGAFPPKQDLSSVHVDFSGVTDAIEKFREKNGKEWLIAGTLHSHPGSSHPSSIDEEDEEKMDGVHLIIPNFGRDGNRGITCHMAASKTRFVVKAVDNFLIDFSISGTDSYPKEWTDQCKFDSAGGQRKWAEHESRYWSGQSGYYKTGNEFTYNGEGEKTHMLDVGKSKFNVLHESFSKIEARTLLRKLGFSKAQRSFLMANFEDDMKDLVLMFDYSRDVLKGIKEVRGDVVYSDRCKFIREAGRATQVALETISAIATRILEQTAGSPKKDQAGAKEEEEEDEKEGEKEESPSTPPVSEPTGKLDPMGPGVHMLDYTGD